MKNTSPNRPKIATQKAIESFLQDLASEKTRHDPSCPWRHEEVNVCDCFKGIALNLIRMMRRDNE